MLRLWCRSGERRQEEGLRLAAWLGFVAMSYDALVPSTWDQEHAHERAVKLLEKISTPCSSSASPSSSRLGLGNLPSENKLDAARSIQVLQQSLNLWAEMRYPNIGSDSAALSQKRKREDTSL